MANKPNRSQCYSIRIRERLGEEWSEWFDGMTIETDGNGTELRGFLADQAALLGMIGRVQRLGLHLVAVNETPYPSDEYPENSEIS